MKFLLPLNKIMLTVALLCPYVIHLKALHVDLMFTLHNISESAIGPEM
jgi:hypothetical protein